jgi:general secretion pathway protein B
VATACSITLVGWPDPLGAPHPPIAVLAASERAALPPLKLSMHVWNSDPGKRFAIIDGQRVTEGGSAGAGVIEEIRRDGVVLNINGRRVLLPRP